MNFLIDNNDGLGPQDYTGWVDGDHLPHIVRKLECPSNALSNTVIYWAPVSCYDNKGNYVWYNHPIYRPCYLHFLSAINKKDLDEIGGFDEIYKDGVDYDDNDFIIKLEKADIDLQIPSGSEIPFGVHLYHENVVTVNRDELSRKNEELFKNKWGGDYKTVLKKVINNW